MFKIALLILLSSSAYSQAGKVTPVDSVDSKQLYCLAQNIFFEARGETDKGKVGVAYVTLNRVKNKTWPNTICEVVWQKYQFSWTRDGKSDNPAKRKNKLEAAQWVKSQFIAWMVITGEVSDPTGNADHYYASYILRPVWAKRKKQTVKLGVHRFYKLR